MDPDAGNRFADFFKESKYVILKNYLYNYLLRKRAIEKCLQQESPTLILEIGSGISPVVTKINRRDMSGWTPWLCRVRFHP